MAKRTKYLPTMSSEERRLKNTKGRPTYRTSKTLDLHLTELQKIEAIKLFNMAKNILANIILDVDVNTKKMQAIAANIIGHIEFDIDAGTKPLEKAADASGMRGGIQKYLKFLS